jgi:hypothetical protein
MSINSLLLSIHLHLYTSYHLLDHRQRERERERETEREREMWNGSKGHTIGEWVSEKRGGGGVCVYKKAFGAWENGVSLLSTKKELLGPSDGAGKGHPPL